MSSVLPRKLIDDRPPSPRPRCSSTSPASCRSTAAFPAASASSLGHGRRALYRRTAEFGYFGERDLLVNVERAEVLKGPPIFCSRAARAPSAASSTSCRSCRRRNVSPKPACAPAAIATSAPISTSISRSTRRRRAVPLHGQYESTHSNVDTIHRQSYTLDPTLSRRRQRGHLAHPPGPYLAARSAGLSRPAGVGTVDRSSYSIRRTAFLANSALPGRPPRNRGRDGALRQPSTRPSRPSPRRAIRSSRIREPSQTPPRAISRPDRFRPALRASMAGRAYFVMLNNDLMDEQLTRVLDHLQFRREIRLWSDAEPAARRRRFQSRHRARTCWPPQYATGLDPRLRRLRLSAADRFPLAGYFRSTSVSRSKARRTRSSCQDRQ